VTWYKVCRCKCNAALWSSNIIYWDHGRRVYEEEKKWMWEIQGRLIANIRCTSMYITLCTYSTSTTTCILLLYTLHISQSVTRLTDRTKLTLLFDVSYFIIHHSKCNINLHNDIEILTAIIFLTPVIYTQSSYITILA
jgi:hypothetical protein